MKTKSKDLLEFSQASDEQLLARIDIILESDLEDPRIESTARAILAVLRKRGHDLPSPDLDDCECLLCLHMALMCAAGYGGAVEINITDSALH